MQDEKNVVAMTNVLKRAVQSLALNAAEQIDLYPNFVEVADELVLEFDECWRSFKSTQAVEHLANHQVAALTALDSYIESISGPSHEEIWTVNALSVKPEWQTIRSLAKSTLLTFGWAATRPEVTSNKFSQ
jgi:hypothetical protein